MRPHPVQAWRSTRHVHLNSNLGDSRRDARRTVYVMGSTGQSRPLFIASLVAPSNSIRRLGFPGTNVQPRSSRSVTIAATIKTTTSSTTATGNATNQGQEGTFQLISTMHAARANKLYIQCCVPPSVFAFQLFLARIRGQIVEWTAIRG